MGGLRKYMPITSITFLIGCLAISGIPPFAGFWSKDEILGAAFQANPILWGIGWLTAGITAFYMFRMYFSTFEGKFRGTDKKIQQKLKQAATSMKQGEVAGEHHDSHGHSDSPHESPWTMTTPLAVLAIPSILIGLVGTPFGNYFEQFIFAPNETLAEVMEKTAEVDLNEFYIMAGGSVAISVVGITLAALMYLSGNIKTSVIASKIQPLYELSLNKWYFDDIYHSVFVMGLRRLARQVLEVDFRVVDGAVNLTGFFTLVSGEGLKYLENGRAQFYALIIFGAVLGLVILFGVT
ncbi:NADH dehydrogenase subunit 5, Involved in CO2 fixation [Richelia intracellularis]|nr:NADH dehydrogenase subunit 5, Involved in CO2 fixation [Richelia intracellularis]